MGVSNSIAVVSLNCQFLRFLGLQIINWDEHLWLKALRFCSYSGPEVQDDTGCEWGF